MTVCAVRLLLENGADTNQKDSIGNTPLHLGQLLRPTDVEEMKDFLTMQPHVSNKKLSYRRETARQLHMTTWAGQLTF